MPDSTEYPGPGDRLPSHPDLRIYRADGASEPLQPGLRGLLGDALYDGMRTHHLQQIAHGVARLLVRREIMGPAIEDINPVVDIAADAVPNPAGHLPG